MSKNLYRVELAINATFTSDEDFTSTELLSKSDLDELAYAVAKNELLDHKDYWKSEMAVMRINSATDLNEDEAHAQLWELDNEARLKISQLTPVKFFEKQSENTIGRIKQLQDKFNNDPEYHELMNLLYKGKKA